MSNCEREESSTAASIAGRSPERVRARAQTQERLHCPERWAIEFRNCASSGKVCLPLRWSRVLVHVVCLRVSSRKVFAFTVGYDMIHQ